MDRRDAVRHVRRNGTPHQLCADLQHRDVAAELARHAETAETNEAISPQVRLARPRDAAARQRVPVHKGKVSCEEFPFVILTSNGERELPPAFLRRCLRLDIQPPKGDHFRSIVRAHFEAFAQTTPLPAKVEAYIAAVEQRYAEEKEYIPTDQLLNVIHMVIGEVPLEEPDLEEQQQLVNQIMRTLG